MKSESIEVIIYLLQSKQPKSFDQIHRFLLNNCDYERRFHSYKKDGKRILQRLLDGLLLTSHFNAQKNDGGEVVYSAYQAVYQSQADPEIRVIEENAANDDDVELSDRLIKTMISKQLADHALLLKVPYLHDEESRVLQTIIHAIQSQTVLDLHSHTELIRDVQPAYIAVKNLQVIVEFEQHDEILSIPLSSIGNAIAKHENLASYRK